MSTNQLYLTIHRLKIRYGSDDTIDYFNHPFLPNEFGLMEDRYLEKPLSIRLLNEALVGQPSEDDEKVEFGKRGQASGKKRKEISEPRLSLENLNNVFSSIAS